MKDYVYTLEQAHRVSQQNRAQISKMVQETLALEKEYEIRNDPMLFMTAIHEDDSEGLTTACSATGADMLKFIVCAIFMVADQTEREPSDVLELIVDDVVMVAAMKETLDSLLKSKREDARGEQDLFKGSFTSSLLESLRGTRTRF